MLADDNYLRIKSYSTQLKATLTTDMRRGVVAATAENEVFAVLMEKENVMHLLEQDGCEFLAAIIGVHLDADEIPTNLTVSLLCVDSNKEVLDAHKTGGLPGQEVWPNKFSLKKLDILLPG